MLTLVLILTKDLFLDFFWLLADLLSTIYQLNDLDGDIKNILVLSRMPKFVWCGEFYKRNDYKHNKVGGLIVIDATEAGASQKDALIFAGYPHQCVYKFGKEFVYLKKGFNLCSKFKNNLLWVRKSLE